MNLPIEEVDLSERLARLSGLDRIREAAESRKLYLVGGAVRDLLLGQTHIDVDLVVEGDVIGLASRLGADPVVHERFLTATVQTEDGAVDLAAARSESYATPGALPEVRPGGVDSDLARRDFTINAMAIPLQGEIRLIDPHGGRSDLEQGLIRVLHELSFVDDPTRALRAARYAGRFGFKLDDETERLVREADLDAVSPERVEAELMRLCAEPAAPAGLGLAVGWGVLALASEAAGRIAAVMELLREPPWRGEAEQALAVYAAAFSRGPGPAGRHLDLLSAAAALAHENPARASEAVRLAAGRGSVELLLARVMGAEWLDRYLLDWRDVQLEITGEDLLSAGVGEGPAIGAGLEAALAKKLDGEITGRDAELAAALAVARSG